MTTNCGFFSDGTEYTQIDFARFLNELIGTGYVPGEGNELEVEALDPQVMKVHIKPGRAYINGYYVNVSDDPNRTELTIDAADANNPRIDRIVLRLSPSVGRTITAAVLKGSAAATPTAPALTRTSQTYEISLAQVLVAAGATSISASAITDERADNTLCGKVMRSIARYAEALDMSQVPTGTISVSRVVGGFSAPVLMRLTTTDERMGVAISDNTYLGQMIGHPPQGISIQNPSNPGTETSVTVGVRAASSWGADTGSAAIYGVNVITGERRQLITFNVAAGVEYTKTVPLRIEEVALAEKISGSDNLYVRITSTNKAQIYLGIPTPTT